MTFKDTCETVVLIFTARKAAPKPLAATAKKKDNMKNLEKISLIICIHALQMVFSFVTLAQTTSWQWAYSAGGSKYDEGKSITTDNSGNVYATGVFNSSTINFGSNSLSNAGVDNGDIFITKYDTLGNVIWTKRVGGSEEDVVNSIIADNFGNIYITGNFSSPTIIFDTITLINSNNPFLDIFVAKYDSVGNIKWAKRAGSSDNEEALNLTSDLAGNIYVVGEFWGLTITFDSITLVKTGGIDLFVTKYDSTGNVIWAKGIGGNDIDVGYSITSDTSDGIYITGAFRSHLIVFGNDTLTNIGYGIEDIFIAKYDTAGIEHWAKSAGGIYSDRSCCIKADNFGNINIAGFFLSPTLTFDTLTLTNNGNSNIFIAQYNANGNLQWVTNFGGKGNDRGTFLTNDANGNIYVTGVFESDTIIFSMDTLINFVIDDTVDYSPGFSNQYDIFISKFDLNGNFKCAISAGGNSFDASNCIAIDLNNDIYSTGVFNSTSINFGTIFLTNVSNIDTGDVFIAKLSINDLAGIQILSLDNLNSFNFYPNPTNGNFTIKVPSATKQIQILNSLGQVVQRKIVDRENSINFKLENSGIYFIQVLNDKQSVTKKIIVTN
ncbi:MAG: SBBP repeat-containing protein [Bacteroidales bacterium]